MFSLSKILALAAIIAVVWYGFKLVGRLDRARKEKVASGTGKANRRASASNDTAPSPPSEGVVDLVKDEKTGAYVSKEGRDDRA